MKKIFKLLTVGVATLGFICGVAQANSVTLVNKSGKPLQVKYQIAHEMQNGHVHKSAMKYALLKPKQTVKLQQGNAKSVGVVVAKVKLETQKDWHALSKAVTAYGKKQTCTSVTTEKHPHGKLVLGVYLTKGDHGTLTCADKT